MKRIEHKRWKQLMPLGGAVHAARVTLSSDWLSRSHTHDFAEIFWVEQGGVLHDTDGVVESLHVGSLVGIRPERQHRVDAPAKRTGVIFNLAFPVARLRALEVAHPEAVLRLFGAVGGAPCPVLTLPEEGLLELRAAGDVLLQHPVSSVEADYRILQVLHWVEDKPPRPPAVPDWLLRGLTGVEHPSTWAHGLEGLHKACGRSQSQVARAMMAALGVTPIAYLNRLRMRHAERQLRLTSRPITDLAAECGFEGLTQFYRLFAATYKESPHCYRRRHQGIVR